MTPTAADKRAPGVADRQIQINPEAAAALGLHEGDYVFVDANPLDRPYIGWADDKQNPRHKAFRCLVRVKLNPGLPHNFTIMKHTGQIATERSVRRTRRGPTGGPWPPTPATRPATAMGRIRALPEAGCRRCTRPTPCSTRRRG